MSREGVSEPRPRPASIRDVARLAGVSHQTVSRVLNGHASIRDVTKSRVLAAMDELQFRPSRAARMLSTQRSETIGVLAAAVGSHYGPASSVSAVEDAARSRGYYATVAHLASVAPGAITAAIEELLSQNVEGIVIVAPRTTVLSRLAALSMNVPIVAAQGEQSDAGGIPVVSVNQATGVRLVLDYLLGQGHRRILHVAGPPDWNDAQSRLRAYQAGLRAAGTARVAAAVRGLDGRFGLRDRPRPGQRHRAGRPAVHRGVLVQRPDGARPDSRVPRGRA